MKVVYYKLVLEILTSLFVLITRREEMKNIITIGEISGKRVRSRPQEVLMDGLKPSTVVCFKVNDTLI